MTVHSVTVDLSEDAYRSVSNAARKRNVPLGKIVSEALSAITPIISSSDVNFHAALAQMAYLSDAHLLQAARTSMPGTFQRQLEHLNNKAQREGLSRVEEEEREKLLVLYRETLLVRAHAAVLLKQRNYDVSDPSQFSPNVAQQ